MEFCPIFEKNIYKMTLIKISTFKYRSILFELIFFKHKRNQVNKLKLNNL